MADSLINHQNARDYWQNIDADVSGMLGGGFPYVSKVDLLGSRAFLRKIGVVGGSVKEVGRAVDCGAGIGRITSGLLLSIAKTVDIVEPISKFTDALSGTPGIGQIFNTGLESWTPSPEPGYDIVWNQWCLGHLTDDQLVNYLNKCRSALTERGLVIVKENLSSSGHDLFDEVDSSVTRTDENLRVIFERAGLKVVQSQLQNGLPKKLFAVRMYALKPKTP
ncbi:S-adenosyl-L-methionine-dependent methyltransferase [Glarea lozoyensis ATCC 20868]|uniref:Alpha N-terminal protein methyltransferase 1 n=1 Tax=Glarea lozoyensis (strain ATCC 20868 / MF5171) TaxID=1116229 RepID=S3CVT3_GLAL2|nr:S-adenosyl-L-methionine-dependent methyltransferase [Glarea lozoyensis ATCC 20868]EPE29740.1 S-adenosyl-L-methionine-dependent methyltransferase [Glarea lozoyensis ATCC 20868]